MSLGRDASPRRDSLQDAGAVNPPTKGANVATVMMAIAGAAFVAVPFANEIVRIMRGI